MKQSPDIFQQISEWGGSELALQTLLRKTYPDDVVRSALLTAELRRRGASKFSRAGQMWFDRKGLEQATSEIISHHKSKRMNGRIWDLCCGIGGDAIAMARHCEVIAVDRNPSSCLRTNWNGDVYSVSNQLVTRCADVTSLKDLGDFVHIDPDRRSESGSRATRIEDYEPGLPFLRDLVERSRNGEIRGGGIKVGPATNFGGKFDDVEIELISLMGECKEATIWFGELAGKCPYRATVLPSGESITGHPLDASAAVSPLSRYLYDPDPALVRSGLIDLFAEKHRLNRLDPEEEYLTSDIAIDSPFADRFEVLGDLPNNNRELRSWVRNSDFGQIEIKCRHIPIRAEEVRRQLVLPGDRPGVVIFVRSGGKSRVVVARRDSKTGTKPIKNAGSAEF
ncbi:MAG: hypothetical protein FJ267_07445 [Planctomycetes bacterium]|nr:hypothetical protein [Planctomycetota bacterium]